MYMITFSFLFGIVLVAISKHFIQRVLGGRFEVGSLIASACIHTVHKTITKWPEFHMLRTFYERVRREDTHNICSIKYTHLMAYEG